MRQNLNFKFLPVINNTDRNLMIYNALCNIFVSLYNESGTSDLKPWALSQGHCLPHKYIWLSLSMKLLQCNATEIDGV